MGTAYVCKHAYRGLNKFLQRGHFPGLADSGLEDTYLCIFFQKSNAQRQTYLRIIAARAAGNEHVRRYQLIEPFLYNGLSIAAGNTYYGDVILITVALCQALQRFERTYHFQEIGFLKIGFIILRNPFHNKVPHTAAIKVGYIMMSIIAFRL